METMWTIKAAAKHEAALGNMLLHAELQAGRWVALVTKIGETLWVSEETYADSDAARAAAEQKGARLQRRVLGMPRRRLTQAEARLAERGGADWMARKGGA